MTETNMQREVRENNEKPLYSGNSCGQVIKRPVYTYNPENDTAGCSIGFAVCDVAEYIEDRNRIAQEIADMMNKAATEQGEDNDKIK